MTDLPEIESVELLPTLLREIGTQTGHNACQIYRFHLLIGPVHIEKRMVGHPSHEKIHELKGEHIVSLALKDRRLQVTRIHQTPDEYFDTFLTPGIMLPDLAE